VSLSYSNKHRQIDEELANINRLHFESDELEDRFYKQFVENNSQRYRLSCLIGVAAILIFLIQDLVTFPEASKPLYLIIRVGVCLPIFILTYFVSNMPSMRRQLPNWIVSCVLTLGVGSVAIIMINQMNGYTSPYEGIMLTIIAAYFLVGLDFRTASMASGIIILSYIYTSLIIMPDDSEVVYNLTFVIITGVICAVSGYSFEKQIRITFLKNEILTIVSQRDGLTGIYNRATLDHKLKMKLLTAVRESQGIAFAMVDIDYFKGYNDHYGHIKGDQTIKAVARALQNCCHRPTDFSARFGGEEFSVVWCPTNPAAAETFAKNIRKEIALLNIAHEKSEVSEHLTVSGGIVYIEPTKLIKNEELFQLADEALYQAKNLGRNQFVIVKP
jgi:diguanylate cyclase (GGDEF)-like protein